MKKLSLFLAALLFSLAAIAKTPPPFAFWAGGGNTYIDASVSGGCTSATSGSFKIVTCLSDGTFTVNNAGSSPNNTVEYLIVGGGGGGSPVDSGAINFQGSGGGAGGYRTDAAFVVTAQAYPVVVGAGGVLNNTYGSNGTDGHDSSFGGRTATGGGGGGRAGDGGGVCANGRNGGSGGGSGCSNFSCIGGLGNTPSTSPSQGNNGANNNTGQAAGGGAGGAASGGTQGPGVSNSITGSAVTYAVGGERGCLGSNAGTANRGNGGGGGGSVGCTNDGGGGAAGGSGIVVIKYRFQP